MQRAITLGLASLLAVAPAFADTQENVNHHVHPNQSANAQQKHKKVKHEDYSHTSAVDHKGMQAKPPVVETPTTMTRDNALHISAGDKSYAVTIFGEVFVVHSLFGGAYNPDTEGNTHFAQQTQLQTARIGVTGNLLKNWTYAVYLANRARPSNPDDNSEVYVRNAFIAYTGWPKFATVTLGKQNPFWGIDNMHDDNDTYGASFTMLSNAFAPPIATGISLKGVLPNAHINWYAGAFHTGVVIRETSGSTRGGQGYQNESRMYDARLGWAPVHNYAQHQVWYIQGAFVHYNGSDDPVTTMVLNGSVHGTLADGGIPPVISGPFAKGLIQDWSNTYNGGTTVLLGRFSFEGGYAHMDTRLVGTFHTTAHYDGYYGQAGFVLTGGERSFDPVNGYLQGVIHPTDRYGAVEVIGRVGHVDLVSNAGKDMTEIGDRATAYTLGLNWYINKHVRFAVDGTKLHVTGPSAIAKNGYGGTLQAGYTF